jgi:hypothetical protein
MRFDDVALATARLRLDELPAADVQRLAIRLLEEGRSSPALYELAGTPAFALEDVWGLVSRMFDELGDQLPTCEEAALLLSQQIANDIVDGWIKPYEGALRIWIHYDIGANPRVAAFGGLTHLIEDHPELRTEGERQIKEEAVRFLAEQREAPRP